MISKEDIAVVDEEGMLGSISTLRNQISKGLKLAKDIRILDEINNVIVVGMGGSALPGEVLKSLLTGSKVKVSVVKDYKLPEWADKKTLVFAVSYSGNTEETLHSFRDGIKKSCKLVAISSGGKLKEMAGKQKTPYIEIPKPFPEFQPRAALGYLFFSILGVLMRSRIIPDMTPDIVKLENTLNADKFKDKAENLAEQLVDKIPIIYASEKLYAAAYKWKIAFNENAKTHAFCNVYPEANHNEINAYVNLKGDFHVIMLTNDDDHIQIRKRFRITKTLYKKRGANVTEIAVKGQSMLAKLFTAILIGDLVAFYLAVKYKTDPTPVKMVEDLKKEL